MLDYNLSENLKKQVEYYEKLLDTYGEKCEALDWNSKSSQELRCLIFKDVFNYTLKKGLAVLDVGCGFGDFWGYLKKIKVAQERKINYYGVDISCKLIEIAKKRYPDAAFKVKNILDPDFSGQFDFVFCSGAFNIRFLDIEAHLKYVKELLLKMFELAKIGIAVNFLSASAIYLTSEENLNAQQYYYFRADEIVNFCRYLSSKYVLRHDYHKGDFTVYLFKQE